MSVLASSIVPHSWPSFSASIVRLIAKTICVNDENAYAKPISEEGSSERDFWQFGVATYHLSNQYGFQFGRKVINLTGTCRWAAFLTQEKARGDFLSACRSLAVLTEAHQILVLPESTSLEDLLYEGASFDTIKQAAHRDFGPPDPDPSKTYTGGEMTGLGNNRVHYFIMSM